MSWDDYCAQVCPPCSSFLKLHAFLCFSFSQHNITGGLSLSDAVASVLEDSVLESVDSTVSNIKSAMKNKRKEKENRTPAASRKKSTRKGKSSKDTASLVTPRHAPPRQAKTPTPSSSSVPPGLERNMCEHASQSWDFTFVCWFIFIGCCTSTNCGSVTLHAGSCLFVVLFFF